jgi:hypothetical protein
MSYVIRRKASKQVSKKMATNVVSWADDITNEDIQNAQTQREVILDYESQQIMTSDDNGRAMIINMHTALRFIESNPESTIQDLCRIIQSQNEALEALESAEAAPSGWVYPIPWTKIVKIGLPEAIEATEAIETQPAVVPEPVKEPVNEHFDCIDCSYRFFFSASQQDSYADRGWSMPKRCRDCSLLNKAKCMDILCKSCTKTFPFSAKQQEYFAKMGFQLPKVCKSCKKA